MSYVLDLIHSHKIKNNIRMWLYYNLRKRRQVFHMVIHSYFPLNENIQWLFDFSRNFGSVCKKSLEQS
jgi:hypothetical protein